MPRQPLGGSPHAAAPGIAQQRREVGGAGKTDPHRVFDAEIAQAADPFQDRWRIEAELGDDVHRHPGRLCDMDLFCQRPLQVLLRYTRVTIGVTCDPDLHDPVALQRAAVYHLDRAAEVAAGLIAVACDHQHAPHPCVADTGEKIVEFASRGEVAHGKVRHRFETCRAQARHRFDCILCRSRRHRAHIDTGAGASDRGQNGDIFRPANWLTGGGVTMDICGCREFGLLRREFGEASLAPARDHVRFVVEPERPMLAQNLARRFQITAVGHNIREPVILDLRHVDRRIPRRK